MGLSPEEIVSYELKQAVRGYSVPQVDELLDQLADQVEAEQLERERLTARLRDAEARLEASQETESTLQRTLVTAQQAAERSLQEAQREADELLERGREQACRIEDEAVEQRETLLNEVRELASRETEEARRRRAALQERVDDLLARERRHRTRLRELLERELDELDRLPAPGEDASDETGAETVPGHRGEVDTPPTGTGAGDVEEQPTEAHGLRVRVHQRVDDQDSDSPLGSPSLRDED